MCHIFLQTKIYKNDVGLPPLNVTIYFYTYVEAMYGSKSIENVFRAVIVRSKHIVTLETVRNFFLPIKLQPKHTVATT